VKRCHGGGKHISGKKHGEGEQIEERKERKEGFILQTSLKKKGGKKKEKISLGRNNA